MSFHFSLSGAFLLVIVFVEALLLMCYVRRAHRAERAMRAVKGVGRAPLHVIDVHRRRTDWAAEQETMALPVVDVRQVRKPRHRRRRKPQQVVPGIDATVIELAGRLTRRIQGGDVS